MDINGVSSGGSLPRLREVMRRSVSQFGYSHTPHSTLTIANVYLKPLPRLYWSNKFNILRQRRDSDPNVDAPSLDFEYADSDIYFNELSELYSYSEVPEFQNTIELFHSNLESIFGAGIVDWRKLDNGQKKDFIMVMLDRFEVKLNYVILKRMVMLCNITL